MLPRYAALISLMALMGICGSAAGMPPTSADSAEDALRRVGLPADGPTSLMLFRKRTPDEDSHARIKSLIAQLGSDSFDEREEASEELAGYGVAAAGLLRAAAHHADLEIRRRARDALASVEQKDLPCDVLIAALHVLARRKPAQMAEVLLDYAPHAADDEILDELCLTLASSARRGGDADPQLVRALTDRSPVKRAVAASALCRGGCHKQLPAIRRLLRESDPQVRRRVALALLETHDKAAIPALIDLLTELPLTEAERVESVLLQVATDKAPKGNLEAARWSYRDAWAEWWERHGDGLDLAKIELSLNWRGYTLAVCSTAFRAGRGRGGQFGGIVELDALGRTRWQMKGLSYPVDAQVLDERRILVTEYRLAQVTERNHNGDVLRRIRVPDLPLEARRLPSGNTLITTTNRVFEIDHNDKEVWKLNGNPLDTIASACRFRGGEFGICYRSGEFVRLDRNGKVLTSFRVGRVFRSTGTHIQGLPNGHVLIPLYSNNKVVEFDEKGQEVWSAEYTQPICAQRLPNGRTLVAGYGNTVFVELDKNGREVKSQRCDAPLMFVSGR
jgi:HEAT repeat protein